MNCVGESAEALPVADKARRFRGSAPIGGRVSARESAGATVGKRPSGRPVVHPPQGRRGRRSLRSTPSCTTLPCIARIPFSPVKNAPAPILVS